MSSGQLDAAELKSYLDKVWEESCVPKLTEYITIPNKSPFFDPKWQENGHMDKAMDLLLAWARARKIAGMEIKMLRPEGRTPMMFIEIPATSESHKDDTVLLYGHMDKQPECEGWDEGLGPWTPVRKGDRLYGRGGADDGYSVFAALTAIEALQAQGVAHARLVVTIEAAEESGSPDIPYYMEELKERIGDISLIVCLDSGAGNYEQLWLTNALRGFVACDLNISLLTEGVHSGAGSGLAASSFRVMRQLLDRLEDKETGKVLLESMHVDIPEGVVESAKATAEVLGAEVYDHLPLRPGVSPLSSDVTELVLNNTWRPTLCVIGAEGFPKLQDAGNVLRERTAVKLSFRLPPTADPEAAAAELENVLKQDPPYGAHIEVSNMETAKGWAAPSLDAWLANSLAEASRGAFGDSYLEMGEGGSIPFMAMLGEKYPKAQFVVTGVLGPESNAHGPNEFLHIPMAVGVSACVAQILADHAKRED